jgi:hypothetical protein
MVVSLKRAGAHSGKLKNANFLPLCCPCTKLAQLCSGGIGFTLNPNAARGAAAPIMGRNPARSPMTAQPITLNTDAVAPRDRAPQWREWVYQHFGGLESDLYGDMQFRRPHGRLARGRCDPDAAGSQPPPRAAHARMARTSDTGYLKIVAPWQGARGGAARPRGLGARSGEWIIYDTTQPYAIANPERGAPDRDAAQGRAGRARPALDGLMARHDAAPAASRAWRWRPCAAPTRNCPT